MCVSSRRNAQFHWFCAFRLEHRPLLKLIIIKREVLGCRHFLVSLLPPGLQDVEPGKPSCFTIDLRLKVQTPERFGGSGRNVSRAADELHKASDAATIPRCPPRPSDCRGRLAIEPAGLKNYDSLEGFSILGSPQKQRVLRWFGYSLATHSVSKVQKQQKRSRHAQFLSS